MCRLLGVVSTENATLTQSLAGELEPFSQLSSEHCDGWGLAAWNAADDLVVSKHCGPAQDEPGLLAECDRVASDAALLHLRKASVGIPVSLANTHPFAAGSVAFAHNGYFPPSAAIDELLAQFDAEPAAGQTDSERYFKLVLALLRTSGPVSALTRAAAMISERAEVVSLNALMLTNQALYAFCYYHQPAEPDLAAGPAGYELRFRVSAAGVVVASSGWEQPSPAWELLASGRILEVRRHDLCVSVHRPAKALAG
jgi:predicted glutamine amidotransferase